MPLKALADKLHYGQPLLEYAYGYALNNWKLVNDPNPNDLEYKNNDLLPPKGTSVKKHINMIRKLNGCTNEAGFVLVHVAIVTQTNRLVQAQQLMFEGTK